MVGDTKKKTVLIVDDDEEVRRVAGMICGIGGYEVVGEAANGIDAEQVATATRPSFVVLDYMMPFQDGARTAKILRKILPAVQIVAVSAVIHEKPDWADAFVDKTNIDGITDTLDRLFATTQ